MKFSNFLIAAVSASFLVACGGGGGDSPAGSGTPTGGSTAPTATATPGQAQGFYAGNFVFSGTPRQFQLAILENDEYWALYGLANAGGGLTVFGFIQGQGTTTNGTFTSSNLRDFGVTPAAAGSLSATYQTGISVSGTVTANGTPASFAANTSASDIATYNTPANLADITGSWVGTALDGVTTFNLSIGATGAISGSSAAGCTVSGTMASRASGKNVFDVHLTTAASAACGTAAGQSGNGIGASSLLSNGKRQLLIALVSADRSTGTVLFSTR